MVPKERIQLGVEYGRPFFMRAIIHVVGYVLVRPKAIPPLRANGLTGGTLTNVRPIGRTRSLSKRIVIVPRQGSVVSNRARFPHRANIAIVIRRSAKEFPSLAAS